MQHVFRFMPEAWPGTIILCIVAVLAQYTLSFFSSLPIWFILIAYVWLHRDPKREISRDPLAIVGPIDGKVVRVGQVEDPYLARTTMQVSIKKNFLNLFHLRSPIEGTVQKIAVVADTEAAGQKSAYVPYAIWIKTDEQDDVILIAEAARLMRRPRIYTHPGQRVGQGQRLGYAPFGRIFDIHFPLDAKMMCALGDLVLGGSSIVAKFTHK